LSLAACDQPFDTRYESKCDKLKDNGWRLQFFYNKHNDACQQFWYGGCQFGESQNIFGDEQSCEQLCLKQPRSVFREMAATTTEMPFPGIL
jgi:hypothetical protein